MLGGGLMRPAIVAALAAGLLAGAIGYRTIQPKPPQPPVIGPGSISYEMTAAAQARRSQMLVGALLVFGDSLTVGLATSLVAPDAENFGINSDTIAGLTARLPLYRLAGQRGVVLAIGLNDFAPAPAGWRAAYARLLAAIPPTIPVTAVSITPTARGSLPANSDIDRANGQIRLACADRPGCRFLDLNSHLKDRSGFLDRQFDAGDGIHLSPAGSRVWIAMLK